jgi:hypothetical protein
MSAVGEREKFFHKGVSVTYEQTGPKTACIYEFFSHTPGKGEAREALLEMRKDWDIIVVTDIGFDDEPSHQFWRHMVAQGLVDEAHDPCGEIIVGPSAQPDQKA